ncbi:MAG: MFS transporter [Burkholderiaceae bacterium]
MRPTPSAAPSAQQPEAALATPDPSLTDPNTRGSRAPWLMLFLAWIALLATFVDRLAWSNVNVQVGATLGLPLDQLNVFVTAFYVGYCMANAAGGLATDWLGPRRTLGFALVPLGLCTFLFGSASSVGIGLMLQLGMGLAAGADYSACVKLTANWFPQRVRGRAMGLLMTASSLGVVVANATVPSLASHFSWNLVYHLLGGVTLCIGLVCLFYLKDTPLPTATSRPAGALREMLGNRDLVLMALAGFGALWGTWGFAVWSSALMIKGYGIAPTKAGFIVSLFGLGAIAAKPLVGILSDWLGGRRKGLIIACLLSFVVMLLIYGRLDNETGFMLIAPLLGITAFVYSPLTAALVVELAGPRIAGSATGFTNAFWQLGNVTVPLAVGMVFQTTHSFYAAFVTLAAGPLFGAVVMLAVRERARSATGA